MTFNAHPIHCFFHSLTKHGRFEKKVVPALEKLLMEQQQSEVNNNKTKVKMIPKEVIRQCQDRRSETFDPYLIYGVIEYIRKKKPCGEGAILVFLPGYQVR